MCGRRIRELSGRTHRSFSSSDLETKHVICMVAERCHRFARQCFNTYAVSCPHSSQAMAHPMLRGAAAAVIGDALVRAASVGIVSFTVEYAIAAVNVQRAEDALRQTWGARLPFQKKFYLDTLRYRVSKIYSKTTKRNTIPATSSRSGRQRRSDDNT